MRVALAALALPLLTAATGAVASPGPDGVNITYGQGLVCPASVSTCKWGAAANRTGYVSKPLLLDHYSPTNGSTKPASGWPALIMVHGGACKRECSLHHQQYF